jgi:pimeloyl-ACP methyl ester carboxylesterase
LKRLVNTSNWVIATNDNDRPAQCFGGWLPKDLKAITVPTLILQGYDDQVVPLDDSGRLSVKLVKNGTLKVYPGYPHGMLTIHADVINPDLLAFIREGADT